MSPSDIPGIRSGHRRILLMLHSMCLVVAVMMLMTVSVQPAMAQMEAKEKVDAYNKTLAQYNQLAGAEGCPGCQAGDVNGTLSSALSLGGGSLKIRQIALEGGTGSESVGETETHSVGNLTVTANEADWQEEKTNPSVSVMGADGDKGVSAPLVNSTEAERLADFDNDPEVKAIIQNVTAHGFTTRNYASVERYGFEYNLTNTTLTAAQLAAEPAVIDIAHFVYTNSTGYRYKFYASQSYAADGTQIPPKVVTPIGVFSPLPQEKNPHLVCWWMWALLVLAILFLLALIIYDLVNTGIGLYEAFWGDDAPVSIETWEETNAIENPKRPLGEYPHPKFGKDFERSDMILRRYHLDYDRSFGRPVSREPLTGRQVIEDMQHLDLDKEYWLPSEGGGRYWDIWDTRSRYYDGEVGPSQKYYDYLTMRKDFYDHTPPAPTTYTVRWSELDAGMTILLRLKMSLTFALLSPSMISLGVAALLMAIEGVLVCEGYVQSENEREYLELRINSEKWNVITEEMSGTTVSVPASKPNVFMIPLKEYNESGVRYTWESDMYLNSAVYHAPNSSTWTRLYSFMVGTDGPTTFHARYVRADDREGPAIKEFNFTTVPMTWSNPESVEENIPRWNKPYGPSMAMDPATDRMHIAYLELGEGDATTDTGMYLKYVSGIGSHWDPPVIVDDQVSAIDTRGELLEMSTTTSIALDADGNPHISYRDNKNGHLKYATLQTDRNARFPGSAVHNGWITATVDNSSAHTGWGSSIAIGHDGNPRIAYLHQDGWEGDLQLRYAAWNGTAWKIQQIHTLFPRSLYGIRIAEGASQLVGKGIFGEDLWGSNIDCGESPSLALDSADLPHISFPDYVRTIGSNPLRPNMDSDAWEGGMTMYNQRSGRNNYDILHMWMAPNGTWSTEVADNMRFNGPLIHYTRHGLYSSIAIDREDHPHISYFTSWDSVNQKMIYDGEAMKSDSISYFWRLPSNYYKLGYLKYTSSNGKEWKSELVDDSSIAVGRYSSLKIDKDGNPHIAYMDYKNNIVRYATRDHNGKLWSLFLPDPHSKGSGDYSSIGLDSHGNPRIATLSTYGGVQAVFGKFDTPENVAPRHLVSRNTPATPEPTEVTLSTTEVTITPTDVTLNPTVVPVLPPDPVVPVPSPTTVTVPLRPIQPPDQNGILEPASPDATSPGGATTSPASPAGQAVTSSFGTQASSDAVAVHSVSFTPDRAVPEAQWWARQEKPLSYFRLQNGPAFYENIHVGGINPSAIHDARIRFSVTKAWLDENHVDPANVVMMHQQDDNTWAGLPTTFERQDGDRYYYTATTPGFSYFAVTDKTTAEAATVPTAEQPVVSAEKPDPAPQAADSVTPVPIKAKAPVHPAVVVTGTMAPAPAGTGPVPGLPLLWIAVAALISMLGVAGFFIGRRMWWKHQNPNLFRKYD